MFLNTSLSRTLSFTVSLLSPSFTEGTCLLILFDKYRSGTVNSNTVNSKFHLMQMFYEVSVNIFSVISFFKNTVNSNFHLIRSKTLPTTSN